jgi:DNA-binding IclR family transcriptional regulator
VVICIDRLPGYRRNQHDIEFYTAIGTRRPAHTTAMGKMLLASLPDHEQRDLLSRLTLTKNTGYTITSRTVLGTELQTIRPRGFARVPTKHSPAFQMGCAVA